MSLTLAGSIENPCMPDLTITDVRDLQAGGYARLGRAFAILTVDGQLLSALHSCDGTNGHPKTGLYGPISETVAGRINNEGQVIGVETMQRTFSRCVFEEIGTQPGALPLRYGHSRKAPDSVWPIDGKRNLFAQTGVLFLDPSFDHEQFVGNFTPTTELGTIAFMSIGQFLRQNLRMGARVWAEQLRDGGFMQPTTPLTEASMQDWEPNQNQGYTDLRLDELRV